MHVCIFTHTAFRGELTLLDLSAHSGLCEGEKDFGTAGDVSGLHFSVSKCYWQVILLILWGYCCYKKIYFFRLGVTMTAQAMTEHFEAIVPEGMSSQAVEHGLRAVDFFCGAGGMTHGMLRAGISVLGGIDNAEDCRMTYEANNAPATFINADVEKLTADELSGLLGIVPDDDRLIFIGCSPCQYWSKIQTEKRKSEKSAFLLREFERFVSEFRPGFVVLENVPGLKTNSQSYLPDFLKFLAGLGYVFDEAVVDASGYGVPQHRKRFLLVATRVLPSISLPEKNDRIITVREVIGEHNGFPRIPAGHIDETSFAHSTAGLSEDNLQRIRMTPKNGGDRNSWKDTDLQIPAYKGKDGNFRDVYGRIYWDRTAPTITTKFHSLSNGRFGHPEEDRALSLREGACLQTFPGDYIFHSSSRGSIAKQIGNAVPPALAERIGAHIIRILTNGHF